MCGIFGIITAQDSDYPANFMLNLLKDLATLSESRGKDSSGLAFRDSVQKRISILKGPLAIEELFKEPDYNNFIKQVFPVKRDKSVNNSERNLVVFGHARLVTNGTQLEDVNNQPVVKDGIIGIHNGIIVNVDDLWARHKDLDRHYEIDTEVMLALTRKFIGQAYSVSGAISKSIQEVFGTVATAMMFADKDVLALATNNGSLYILTNHKDVLIFASEKHILKSLSQGDKLESIFGKYTIKQVQPNHGYLLYLHNFKIEEFRLDKAGSDLFPAVEQVSLNIEPFTITTENIKSTTGWSALVDVNKIIHKPGAVQEEKLLEYNIDRISNLKRCTKCLLPETFPYIEFNNEGVCNICRNYKLKNQTRPIEELMNLVEPYRSRIGEPDCIVPFSGGRDSSYTLHIVKRVLGLNPIALTYDWGMVTDLARRNIARICGSLGIENIIVAANIRMKRENIRKNVAAWLKRPQLGMIPLFMAGDKYFFYYTNQLKMHTGIKLNIWGVNNLENTDFKVGFCGVGLDFDKKRIYSLKKKNQFKLINFYAKNYLTNPAYINSSLVDTIGSFLSRFRFPQEHYYHLFDYMRWDEKEIESVILQQYDWETARDTRSTWRIGDGTASFYNYIYYTIAGFSEIETFRGNQIREGLITREEAWKLACEENRPRYESVRWYLDIIGLDYTSTIKKINKIPKLY